jgi:hypothetical protein
MSQPKTDSFSPHLFWDVDKTQFNFENQERFLIKRVLEYGLLNDWLLLKKRYGIDFIAEIATGIRDLDPKAMTFIALISNKSKEKFLCYTTRQSNPPHWNF